MTYHEISYIYYIRGSCFQLNRLLVANVTLSIISNDEWSQEANESLQQFGNLDNVETETLRISTARFSVLAEKGPSLHHGFCRWTWSIPGPLARHTQPCLQQLPQRPCSNSGPVVMAMPIGGRRAWPCRWLCFSQRTIGLQRPLSSLVDSQMLQFFSKCPSWSFNI